MAEAGVDISAQRSKGVDEFLGRDFDFVITLCDNARENCPFFPGEAKLVHRGFEDPPVLASKARSEEEAMVHYRRVRDEIRDFVGGLPGLLDEGG
jgi:arsenate reductase